MPEPELSEVSCETCVAACCRAPIYMQLSKKELKQHGPTLDLEVVVKPNRIAQSRTTETGREIAIPIGYGLYELKSGCANLNDENRCTIYPWRPQCCRDLRVGSPECLHARRKAGLDGGPEPEDAPTSKPAAAGLIGEFFSEERAAPVVRPAAPPLAEIVLGVSRNATGVIDQLSACDGDDWMQPTCCSPWTVGDVAAHLVDGATLAQRVLDAAVAGRGAQTPAPFKGDQPTTIAALRGAQRDLVHSLNRVTPKMLFQEVVIDDVAAVTLKHLVDAIATEFTVHRRDIAVALGKADSFDATDVRLLAHVLPDVLNSGSTPRPNTSYLLRSTAFELALAWRDNEWRCEAGRDPCTIEGEPNAVLLYALGRDSFDSTRITTTRAEQARSFKRYLTGP